jgi:hypothetical protein
MKTWTPNELAQAYAETINGKSNGWGQYCHPTLGRSDFIMLKLWNIVGKDQAEKLIDDAMKVSK